MTLGDLLKTGWVKDGDTMTIVYGDKRIIGNWYEDKILNLTDKEINGLIYVGDDKWGVSLSDEEVRADA